MFGWDEIFGVARLLLWAVLFATVIPRVAFSKATFDPATQGARTSLLVAFGTVVLWVVGQLHVSTFLVLVVVTLASLRKLTGNNSNRGVSPIRRTYLRLLHFLYQEQAESGDLALRKGEKPQDASSAIEDARGASRLALDYVARALTHGGKRLLWRLSGVSADAWGRIFGCTVLSLFAIVRRLNSGTPVAPQDAALVLRREGWARSAHWISDLAATEFVEQLTQSAPIVATTLALAPLVFIHGIATGALLRRLAPNVPSFLGSLSALAPVLMEDAWLVSGVTTSVLLAPTMAWACWIAHDSSRRAGFAWALGLTGCFFAVSSGVLVLGALLLSELVVFAEQRSLVSVRWGRVIVAVFCISMTLNGLSGVFDTVSAPNRLPAWVSSFFLAVCAWIFLGAAGVREMPERAAVRGLSLTTAACLLCNVSSSVPHVIQPNGATCLGLGALCVCLVFGQLLRSRRFALVFYPAPLSILFLAGWMSLSGARADERPAISRDELELVSRIEDEVLPWGYTLVAPPSFVAALAGRSWFVDESQVEAAFPARKYRFHPRHPERMIGTEWTFIATDASGNAPGARWVRALMAEKVAVRPRTDLSNSSWTVFAIRRDRKEEVRLANLLLRDE